MNNFIYFSFNLKNVNSKVDNQPFRVSQHVLSDFYLTNSIARASPTLAKCVKSFEQNIRNKHQEKQQQHN